MAFDAVTYAAAKGASKKYTDIKVSEIPSGYNYKGNVATASDLPLSGNAKGDMYIAQDTGHEYVWSIDAASGTLDNWVDKSKELDTKMDTPTESSNNDTLIYNESTDKWTASSLKTVNGTSLLGSGDIEAGKTYYAGSNVTISADNTISAQDTIYDDTAIKGRVTTIEGKEATWDAKQNALTAGSNVTISGTTISAQDTTYSAGSGITITNDIVSLDPNASVAIYDDRIADADDWTTNGYTKTSAEIPTANLPAECTGNDRWGVLLYVAENNSNHAGLQQYFPIDGDYKGRVFYRSVTGWSEGIPPTFGAWNILPWSSEKQDTLTAGANITIGSTNSNGQTVISAVDTTYTAGGHVTIENEVITADDDLQESITVTNSVGTVAAGEVLPVGTSLEQIVRRMLTASTPTTGADVYYGAVDGTVPTSEDISTLTKIAGQDPDTLVASGLDVQLVSHYIPALDLGQTPTIATKGILLSDWKNKATGWSYSNDYTSTTIGDYHVYYFTHRVDNEDEGGELMHLEFVKES